MEVIEVGDDPADRFKLESKIAPDIPSCHGQPEAGFRVTAGGVSFREIEQKGGNAFLSAHGAKQEQIAVHVCDFRTHHTMKVILQCRNGAAKFL